MARPALRITGLETMALHAHFHNLFLMASGPAHAVAEVRAATPKAATLRRQILEKFPVALRSLRDTAAAHFSRAEVVSFGA